MPPCFDDLDEAEGQTYRNLDCAHATVRSITFTDCVFERCAFSDAQLLLCTFANCLFRDCDLSLINPEGSAFVQVRFEACKVIGVNWTVANWDSYLSGIHFVDCSVNYATFIGLDLKGITLKRCVAWEADFAEANLTGADCTKTDFRDSRFLHTDLTEVDFTGASNYAIAANLNTLKKTQFSLPEAMNLLHSLDIILTDPETE